MVSAMRRSEITIEDLLSTSDSDDLLSSSDSEAQGRSEDEDTETTGQLLSLTFPAQYKEARSESRTLAAISTVTDARTRLTREQLEADLPEMDPGVHDLAQAILHGVEPKANTKDVYARESRLQYWLISADGTKQLFSEWIRFLEACPKYLACVPFDVQETIESLHVASVQAQQRALKITFNSKPLAIHRTRKRPAETKDDSAPAKRIKTDFNATQSVLPSASIYSKDGIHGRCKTRWPQSRINAWEKIMGVPSSELPATAFSAPRHELESHCTPVSADITQCKYPVSIEEVLTYFPDHTHWRELAQRLRKFWPAKSIASFIFWSRTIRTSKTLERTRLQHRLDVAKKATFNTHATTVAGSMENISSVSAVQDIQPYDVFVCDLAEGVRHHPIGKGAQLLTRVVQYALKHEDPYHRQLKLSEVVEYAAKHNITVPEEDKMGPVAEIEDKAALDRHRKVIIGWCKKYTT